MSKLTEAELQQRLATVPDWQLEGKRIVKRFRFETFPAAIRFVDALAKIAEERNHHPFISIDYRVVTLQLTSWHAGGLTDMDFSEAMAFDALYDGDASITE